MRKCTAVLLVISTVLFMTSPALAATPETVSPRYSYTDSVYALIEIDNILGIVRCQGDCIAKDLVPVKVVVYLQQYRDGAWVTLKSWQSTGTAFADVAGYYAVPKGYNYCTYTIGYVYNTDGTLVEIVSAADYMYY